MISDSNVYDSLTALYKDILKLLHSVSNLKHWTVETQTCVSCTLWVNHKIKQERDIFTLSAWFIKHL
jgi:hypothetical protein